MEAVHALDSTKNMKECSQGSQRLKKTVFYEKVHKPGGRVFLIFSNGRNGKKPTNKNKSSQNPYRVGGRVFLFMNYHLTK